MIVITNNEFTEQVKNAYDDYRVDHVIMRCGYDSQFPLVMEIRDREDNTIKQVNVSADIHVKCMGVVVVVKCENGAVISMIKLFK